MPVCSKLTPTSLTLSSSACTRCSALASARSSFFVVRPLPALLFAIWSRSWSFCRSR